MININTRHGSRKISSNNISKRHMGLKTKDNTYKLCLVIFLFDAIFWELMSILWYKISSLSWISFGDQMPLERILWYTFVSCRVATADNCWHCLTAVLLEKSALYSTKFFHRKKLSRPNLDLSVDKKWKTWPHLMDWISKIMIFIRFQTGKTTNLQLFHFSFFDHIDVDIFDCKSLIDLDLPYRFL